MGTSRSTGFLTLALVALLLVGVACSQAPAQPTAAPAAAASATGSSPQFVLKAVAMNRTMTTWGVWETYAQNLNKATNGRVQLNILNLPELGLTGFEAVPFMKNGLTDMLETTYLAMSGVAPLVEGVELPGIFKDQQTARDAHKAWDTKYVNTLSDQTGGRVFAGMASTPMVLFSKKEINSLSDLKGMKIRVFGNSQTDYVKAFGGEPVPLALADVYSSLERGTVDGCIVGLDTGLGLKFAEVAPNVVDILIGWNEMVFMVTNKTWDRLPEDIRKQVMDLGVEATNQGWELGKNSLENGQKNIAAKGAKWIAAKPEWVPVAQDAVRKTLAQNWASRSGPTAKATFNDNLSSFTGFKIE